MAVKWYLNKDDVSWHTFWDKTSIEDELAEAKNDYPRMLNVILDNSINSNNIFSLDISSDINGYL